MKSGRKKFAVLETKRVVEVAEIWRFVNNMQENQDRNYRWLLDAIKYL